MVYKESWYLESAGLDSEVQKLLLLLERGHISIPEFVHKFRRIFGGDEPGGLLRNESGLVYTDAWASFHKKELDAINRAKRDIERAEGELQQAIAISDNVVDMLHRYRPDTLETVETYYTDSYDQTGVALPLWDIILESPDWFNFEEGEDDILLWGEDVARGAFAEGDTLGGPNAFVSVGSEEDANAKLAQAVSLWQRTRDRYVRDVETSLPIIAQITERFRAQLAAERQRARRRG